MLFERSQTELAVLEALERGSKLLTKEMLEALLSLSIGSWKPAFYDTHQRLVRQRYEGRAVAIHRRARMNRYPTSWQHMPDVSFNWTALVASVDASVYAYEPKRFLVDDDEEALPDDSDEAKAFARLVKDAGLASVMPEMERRLMAARTVFGRIGWEGGFDDDGTPLDRGGCPRIDLYWPQDVYVIPHPSRPTSLETAVALLARQSGVSGMAGDGLRNDRSDLMSIAGTMFGVGTTFEVWTRPIEEKPDGTIAKLGPWSVERADLRGGSAVPFGSDDSLYAGQRLPWFVAHASMPAGCPYVDEDHDTHHITDALNVGWSNVLFVADTQGHDQPVISGNTVEAADVAVGPDVPIILKTGDSATMLSANPKLAEMLEIGKTAMRTLAVTRRQSPDAYATERGPTLTGVSRKIANEPQDKARLERQHPAVVLEERHVMPILLEQARLWGDGFDVIGEDLSGRMTPRDPPEFEDAEARQRRTVLAEDVGYISKPRAAVESGWYRTEEEARAALEKIKEEAPPPSALPLAPSAPSAMQAALLAAEAGKDKGPPPPTPADLKEA